MGPGRRVWGGDKRSYPYVANCRVIKKVRSRRGIGPWAENLNHSAHLKDRGPEEALERIGLEPCMQVLGDQGHMPAGRAYWPEYVFVLSTTPRFLPLELWRGGRQISVRWSWHRLF
jgi:hypothetical protein